MSPGLRIVRQLTPEDQRARELVIGIAVPGKPDGSGKPPARKLPSALAQLNRRVVELALERAGIESVLAGVRRRIAHLTAEADRLEAQLAGITLGEPGELAPEQSAEVDRVLLAVAKELGVPIAAILGRRGKEPVCWARFIALTLALDRARTGYALLGRYLQMDHATVIWATRKTAALREACPAFRAQWERCLAKLETQP